MLIAYTNATIFTGNGIFEDKTLLIRDGIIEALVEKTQIPEGAEVLDLNQSFLAPGLIDLQVYGSGGRLLGSHPDAETLRQMENDFIKQGTTGFLATIATNTDDIVERSIAAAREFRKETKGAFLGLHLEGPFLNQNRKGAHPEKHIKKASLEKVQRWIDQADGEIKMMTIAPELQDRDVIEYLKHKNVLLSAGHTDASYDEGNSFFPEIIPAATHLFNAMQPMHHRSPGIIPAIFKKKPFTSIVADGIHVSFPMIELAKRELEGKLFLITDAVTETNTGIYQHQFQGTHYTMPDGTLSGSSLSMLKAVSNCVKKVGIQLAEALRMGSTYPAQLLGRPELGSITVGNPACFFVFNNNFEVEHTLLPTPKS